MSSYGGINNHFGWVKQRSAWQDMEYHRQKRAEYAAQDQANMDAMNAAMSGALQNQISVSSTNAAQQALDRVKAAAQAKVDANNKQIDDAQNLLDQTSKALGTTTATTSSTSNVLDTTT
jgi:hypothetical protein